MGGGVSIVDSTFTNNEAQWGGGAMLQSAGDAFPILISGTTFDGNRARANHLSSSGSGGGVYVYYGGTTASPVRIQQSTFSANHADRNGGGLMLDWFASAVSVETVTFSNNTATLAGGGLFSESESLIVADSLFSSNDAQWGGAARVSSRGAKDHRVSCAAHFKTILRPLRRERPGRYGRRSLFDRWQLAAANRGPQFHAIGKRRVPVRQRGSR